MSNILYPKGAEKLLSGAIDLTSATIKATILPSSYSYSGAHEFLSDLGSVLGTAQTLASKTVTNGVFDCADLTWTAVASGATAKAIAFYKDTGSPSTSPVFLYVDQITGWPLATNGGNITAQIDNGAYKLFSL